MKSLPLDPMGKNDRLIAALCEDLLDKEPGWPRANAVCEIARQMRSEASEKAQQVHP